MIENKELEKLLKQCKTSKEAHELQIAFTNETIGRITDNQAIKIIRREQELLKKESECAR